MAEEFGFEQVLRDRGAIYRDEDLVRARALHVHEAREHFLAGAAFARNQDRGFGACDLCRKAHDARHRFVAEDEIAAVVGDGCEHSRDQFRIGRERNVFFRAGVDRIDRGAGIGLDAAGDYGGVNPLVRDFRDQFADVERDIGHDQVRAACAQHFQALLDIHRVSDAGAAIDRDLGRRRKLALEGADDE